MSHRLSRGIRMKIVIPGGSGQVGVMLIRAFQHDGHEVVVLSRGAQRGDRHHGLKSVHWDGETLGDWAAELDGADVLINLAGRSVNCRYHEKNRQAIMQSRLRSTRVLGEALAQVRHPPSLWLQASTATIYAHRYDAANDETSGILGGHEPDAPDTWNFSIDVAKSWEAAAVESKPPGLRQVLMRSAMTMSPDPGGVFDVLLGLVRFGLGGKVGNGKQFVSWIHEHDFVRALYWIMEHDDLEGPVNLSAPNPLPYADFMRQLRAAYGARLGLPATEWMLEVGTFLMRSESELVIKSRRVVPGKLTDSGFSFQYPQWQAAANELCRRWREGQRKAA